MFQIWKCFHKSNLEKILCHNLQGVVTLLDIGGVVQVSKNSNIESHRSINQFSTDRDTLSPSNNKTEQVRVSGPMLNPVLKFVHFMDYLNFGALFDFFLWSSKLV